MTSVRKSPSIVNMFTLNILDAVIATERFVHSSYIVLPPPRPARADASYTATGNQYRCALPLR